MRRDEEMQRRRETIRPGTPRVAAVLVAVLLCWVSGCAKPAGPVFEPLATPIVWPAPPDAPRVRYVGQLSTSLDLKPPRGGLEGLGEALFGKKSAQSMLSPFAVCTDGESRLYVADTSAQVVHCLDLEKRTFKRIAPPKSLQMTQPVGIAYDEKGNGRILVADSVGGVIFSFSPDGDFLGLIGQGIVEKPAGVAVQPHTGRIFVADVGTHQIVVLEPDGRLAWRLGKRGSGPSEFNYPTNIAFETSGRFYVSDSLNFRIQQFTAGLGFIRSIGKQGDVPGTFSQPKGLAVSPAGHLYVVDSRFESIQVFDYEGRLLMYFGDEGTGPGQFWLPAGVFVDGNSRIWVADSYNRRIQVFDYLPAPAGTEVAPITRPATQRAETRP